MATLSRARDRHSSHPKHSDALAPASAADAMQTHEETREQEEERAAPTAPRILPGSYQYRGGKAGCPLSAVWQRSLHMDARRSFDQSSWFVKSLSASPQGVHSLASLMSDAYVPCFALHYHPSPLSNTITASSSSKHGSLLVAGDENGWLHFLHTNCPSYEQQWATRTKFRAHENAIFEFQWCDPAAMEHSGEITEDRTGPIADLLITASGDQTLKVWDINQQECLYTLKGHKGSIKTVRMQPGNQNIYASGSRDGSFRLYDVRERSDDSPTDSIDVSYCFKNAQNADPWKAKRKKQTAEQAAAAMAELPNNFQSVTSLVFAAPHIIVTAGASNASIKAWDTRFVHTRFGRDAIILPSSLPYGVPASATRKGKGDPNLFEPIWQIDEDPEVVSRTRRKHAISSLALDHTGTKLIANSTDSNIYLYDLFNPSQPASLTPQQKFSGHSNTSFYPRSCFSPCGRYIASGSTDYDVYVWDTHAIKQDAAPLDANGGVKPLLSLPGHAHDSNCVAWNPHALQDTRYGFQLASGGDDSTVRMWNVDRSIEEADESGEIIDEPSTPTSTSTGSSNWPHVFSTPLRTPMQRVQRTPRSASARRRLFEDGPIDGPATDSPPVSLAGSSASPAASAASQDRSLAPLNSSTSLSLSAVSLSAYSDAGLAESMRDSTHSTTGSLAHQLRSHLTVSPSKVQMAQEMRAQAREKQRRDASDEEEEEKEGTAAAPAAAAASAVAAVRSSLRPTALNFGSGSLAASSSMRSLPASDSRLVPVFGQVLPVLASSPPTSSPAAASLAASPSSAPFARTSPSTTAAATAAPPTPPASFAAAAAAPAVSSSSSSSGLLSASVVPSCAYLSFSEPWPSSATRTSTVAPVVRRTVILRAPARAAASAAAAAAASISSPASVSTPSAAPAKSSGKSKSATAKKKGKSSGVVVQPRKIREFFAPAAAPAAAAAVVTSPAPAAAAAAATAIHVDMDHTPS